MVFLGTYTATDQDDGDTADLELSIGGDDSAAFVLGDPDTINNNARMLRFKDSPDYETPTDADGNNKYEISIVAEDEDGLTSEKALTITVMNVDELGSVMLSTIQPTIGREVTAELTDQGQWGKQRCVAVVRLRREANGRARPRRDSGC